MLKKAFLSTLIVLLLVSCIPRKKETNYVFKENITFNSLNDENLQDYIMDSIYARLDGDYDNTGYKLEQISSVYVSKEYIEELEYNSKSNIYFGFTLEELEKQFEGKPYVFNVDKDNQTTVEEYKLYENTYIKMLKNVAIGSGVIIFCVTVSTLSGGNVAIIFATAAKSATKMAVSSAGIGGFISTALEFYETKDIKESLKEGALQASDSFKWGAIIGSIVGGSSETINQIKAAKGIKVLDANERGALAEARAERQYGGEAQKSYLNGKEVPLNTQGATRPDRVRMIDGHLEAIEVKNYNFRSEASRRNYIETLRREIASRVRNLPQGSTQRIALDINGRNYTKEELKEIYDFTHKNLDDIYPNIPIDTIPLSLFN